MDCFKYDSRQMCLKNGSLDLENITQSDEGMYQFFSQHKNKTFLLRVIGKCGYFFSQQKSNCFSGLYLRVSVKWLCVEYDFKHVSSELRATDILRASSQAQLQH